jgi:hypothetical protein
MDGVGRGVPVEARDGVHDMEDELLNVCEGELLGESITMLALGEVLPVTEGVVHGLGDELQDPDGDLLPVTLDVVLLVTDGEREGDAELEWLLLIDGVALMLALVLMETDNEPGKEGETVGDALHDVVTVAEIDTDIDAERDGEADTVLDVEREEEGEEDPLRLLDPDMDVLRLKLGVIDGDRLGDAAREVDTVALGGRLQEGGVAEGPGIGSFNAYIFQLNDPKYAVPSSPSAGVDHMAPPVVNTHFCIPVSVHKARIL